MNFEKNILEPGGLTTLQNGPSWRLVEILEKSRIKSTNNFRD